MARNWQGREGAGRGIGRGMAGNGQGMGKTWNGRAMRGRAWGKIKTR